MAKIVTGEQYFELDGQLLEIKRQLRQKGGYPYDLEELKVALQAIIEGEFEEMDFFALSLADAEVKERYPQFSSVLESWRRMATKLFGYDGDIVWEVPAGFTILHAPKLGPCYKDFKHMEDWGIPEEATRGSLAFWIPRLVPDSTSRTVEEQIQLLGKINSQFELPDRHLTSFGSVALLANLILAHHKHTGERIPLDRNWTRTNTRLSREDRLILGHFDENGLNCDYWARDGNRRGYLGCFALGVEELGS